MSHVVQDATNFVTKTVNTVANDVSNVVETAVNNPIPIIEVVAVTLALGPEGLDLSSTIGAPATAAVSNAAVVAANGGSVDDIAKAAAAAAAGSYVSTATGTSVAGTAPDATTTTLANVAGSAAGSAAQTAIMGGNASTILQNALAGGAAAGTAAGASALGASNTAANVLGGAVGGASQAGGNTLAALTGAAGGAARSVSPTGQPTQTAEVVDISQGTQVAGPGGLPPNSFQPGTVTQTASGLFTTYIASDGTVVSVPVTVNQSTGEISTTSTDPGALNAIKTLTVDPTKINPIYYDKTPINPNLTPEETSALAQVSSAFQNIAKNIDLTALTNSAYSENASAALSSPIIQSILQQAQNQSFMNEVNGVLQNIANPDNAYNGVANYNKEILQNIVATYPQLNTQEIQNILNPPLIPLTQGTVNSLNVPNVDVTNVPLPPGVPSDAVLSINPVDNSLVFYSPSQEQTYNQTGQIENPQAPTTPVEQTTTPSQTFPTVGAQPASTALTSALNLPSTGTITTTPTGTQPSTIVQPPTTKGPAEPLEPSAPKYPTVTTTTPSAKQPSTTTTLPSITEQPTAPGVTTPTSAPGPSTEKTKLPSYTPDVFVYGNVPKALAGGPFAQVTQAAPGESVGLGGGGGGVNVESGKEQAPVWNVASLKLKPGEEETADYSNLSSALGI